MARSDRTTRHRPIRRPRRSTYSVSKTLEGSLDATIDGLEQLLASLQRSGMAEGVSGYRTLQAVLVQQKLWALSNRRTTVLPRFQSISRTARKLHRIFAGYAAVMDKLGKLDDLEVSSQRGPKAPSQASSEAAPVAEAGHAVSDADESGGEATALPADEPTLVSESPVPQGD